MLTVSLMILVAGFICTILSALNKCPGWIPLLLLYVWALLTVLPK